jgi:hypothetical protein
MMSFLHHVSNSIKCQAASIAFQHNLSDQEFSTLTSKDYDYDITIFERQETYNEYIRREMMPLLRSALEQEVVRQMSGAFIEETIQQQMVGIVRNLQAPLLQRYEQTLQPAATAEPVDAPPLRLEVVPPTTARLPSTWQRGSVPSQDNWALDDFDFEAFFVED